MARHLARTRSRLARHARTALIVTAAALALAACGRRGALEAPPDPNAPKEQVEADGSSLASSPVPGATKKRSRAVTIPNRPFVLDPLL